METRIITMQDVLGYILKVRTARAEQLCWYTAFDTTDLDYDPKAKARFKKHLRKDIKDLDKTIKILSKINKPFKL